MLWKVIYYKENPTTGDSEQVIAFEDGDAPDDFIDKYMLPNITVVRIKPAGRSGK